MIVAVPLGLLVYTLYEDGAFDTTRNSLLILVAGINRFRRLQREDLCVVEEMNARNNRVAVETENSKEKNEKI